MGVGRRWCAWMEAESATHANPNNRDAWLGRLFYLPAGEEPAPKDYFGSGTAAVFVRVPWLDEPRGEVAGTSPPAANVPTFNHTRADGPLDPCPLCLPLMSREQLVALVRDMTEFVPANRAPGGSAKDGFILARSAYLAGFAEAMVQRGGDGGSLDVGRDRFERFKAWWRTLA